LTSREPNRRRAKQASKKSQELTRRSRRRFPGILFANHRVVHARPSFVDARDRRERVREGGCRPFSQPQDILASRMHPPALCATYLLTDQRPTHPITKRGDCGALKRVEATRALVCVRFGFNGQQSLLQIDSMIPSSSQEGGTCTCRSLERKARINTSF